MGDLFQELTHLVMKAERSYNLLSVSWKTGQASGIIQLAFEGPRTRSFGVQGQKMVVPAPGKDRDRDGDRERHLSNMNPMRCSLASGPQWLNLFWNCHKTIFSSSRL